MTGPLLVCGDTHGQHAHVVRTANELSSSTVILLGDMQPSRPLVEELQGLNAPWYYCVGNHDTDEPRHAEAVFEPSIQEHNLHGRVVELPDGRKVGGLGGIFRGAVWYPSDSPTRATPVGFRTREELNAATPRQARWREGPPMKHWSSIYADEFDRLAKLEADILVTHESGAYRGPMGFSVLDTLAKSMGVKVAIDGHHHDAWEICAAARQLCVAVGLRGITATDADDNATVVLPGELDAEQEYRKQQHSGST